MAASLSTLNWGSYACHQNIYFNSFWAKFQCEYSKGGKRPMKMRLSTHAAAEYSLKRTSLLSKDDSMKDTFIRRDMSEEEWNKANQGGSQGKKQGENTGTGRKLYMEYESKKMVTEGHEYEKKK